MDSHQALAAFTHKLDKPFRVCFRNSMFSLTKTILPLLSIIITPFAAYAQFSNPYLLQLSGNTNPCPLKKAVYNIQLSASCQNPFVNIYSDPSQLFVSPPRYAYGFPVDATWRYPSFTNGAARMVVETMCNNSGFWYRDYLGVNVRPIPVIEVSGPSTIAQGATSTYSAPVVNNATYTWTSNNSNLEIISSTNQPTVTVRNHGTLIHANLSVTVGTTDCGGYPATKTIGLGQQIQTVWSNGDMGQGPGALAWLKGDVDGDGRTDIIQPFDNRGTLGMLAYRSTGSGYSLMFGSSNMGQGSGALAWLTGDVDGDGRTDIIQPFNNNGTLGMLVYRSTGSGYSLMFGSSNMGQGSGALAWLTGDVDGDGRTDIIQPFNNNGTLGMLVYRSTGSGYSLMYGSSNMGQGSGALAWLTGKLDDNRNVEIIQPFDNSGRLGFLVYGLK
jgi:hypothetical protein